MPGPMPKDPAIRQRRNKLATRAVLPPELSPRTRPPILPRHPDSKNGQTWHSMVRRWWRELWASPMASEILRADEEALFSLAVLLDAYWKAPTVKLAAEIRMQRREFGLTPLNRRRLEWTVAQAEEAKDRHEQKRSRRAVIIDGDPREVLDG